MIVFIKGIIIQKLIFVHPINKMNIIAVFFL